MLEDLQHKITRLIALYEGEKVRADALAKELLESNQALQQRQRQIAELKDKIESVQLQSAFTAGGLPQAKNRINALVKEIDKCISLLEDE